MIDVADPWKPIEPPNQITNVSGRRIAPTFPWNIFWAVDMDRNCLLILKHDKANRPVKRLPKLSGIEVEARTPDGEGDDLLVIRLVDNEQREIFHRLCLDIISATKPAQTEQEAIERFLARTWRWHRLLRGGRDGRLSDEEQKGLLGELNVLQHILFPTIGIAAAIRSWTGPQGAPKDFEVGRICIEAKARRGAATPYVTISSEHQLDTNGIDALFLHVSEITAASEGDRSAVVISEVVRSVFEEVEQHDVSSLELFEERLTAVGFDWADDYTDREWLLGPEHLFEVKTDFPRVTPAMYPAGVGNLRYSIGLPECEPFRVGQDELRALISGGVHGD